MKKLIIISTCVLALATALLIIFFSTKETEVEEVCYSIKENHSYLSKDDLTFNVKIYDNNKESLLLYAKESNAILHDKNEENVITVSVLESYISSTTTYNDECFYEYIIKLVVNVSKVKIEECYLTLNFSNKRYVFNIGSFSIIENNMNENILKITDLYGVSSRDNLTLKALVITVNNDTNQSILLSNFKLNDEIKVVLNQSNITSVSDDLVIEDYEYTLSDQEQIKIDSNSKMTFILPVKNNTKLHVSDCFFSYEINRKLYYFSNFSYIKTNDLEGLKPYLFTGIIYDI